MTANFEKIIMYQKEFEFSMISIMRIKDRKIVEE